jgi:hypothetical protein
VKCDPSGNGIGLLCSGLRRHFRPELQFDVCVTLAAGTGKNSARFRG